MFKWLPEGEGSDRDRAVRGFRARLDEIAASGEDMQVRVGKALSLIWRDFEKRTHSLDVFAAADHELQKELVVRLVKYGLVSRDDGNEPESIAAELLSYLLAMIAADDEEGEKLMSRPIEELTRVGDPSIHFRRQN